MKRPRSRVRGPTLAPGASALVLLLASFSVSAETTAAAPVILLQPTNASLAVRRSLARISDELSADRFRVIVADSIVERDLNAVIDIGRRDPEGGMILALFGDPETGRAELCVVARAGRRVAVRRATVIAEDAERMPEMLSTRALELLRATALELSIEGPGAPLLQEPPEPPRASNVFTNLPGPRQTAGLAIDTGIGILGSLEGPPPAWTPVVRVGMELSTWIHVRVSAAGLGSRPRVEAAYGSATLSQSLALLELAAHFRSDKRIRPAVSLGAGVFDVAVDGTGVSPYAGREPRHWSAAFDAGLGLAFVIGSRAALVTELHALVAAPHPVVRFVDTRAATIAYPSFMPTLALQVSL